MTRKATLPKITECVDPMPRVNSFTETRMLQALAAFVLLGALGLAHVHLQFLRTDMKFQQRELQKRVCELIQEEQRLLRANEAYCDRARLVAMARQESMTEVDVRRQKVVMVPAALRKKYEEPIRDLKGSQSALATIAKTKESVSEHLLTFLDVSNVHAASTRAK